MPGETCWLVNHVDHEPGSGARDYGCGGRVYDGHKGTDIGLRNRAVMDRGVAVLAAAPGRVVSVRDGVVDRVHADAHKPDVAGKECGNGVLVQHGNGWVSQYCHLRRGSVMVRRGEAVTAGQRLGLIGMSGQAAFPHVHFEIRQHDRAVDPFTGPDPEAGCGLGAAHLWAVAALPLVAYSPVDIYAMGFAAERPDADAVRAGQLDLRVLSKESPYLYVWGDLFGVRAGDRLRLVLLDPDSGVVLDHRVSLQRDQIRYLHYAARRRTDTSWRTGHYNAFVELERPGINALTRRLTVILTVE
ncbi:MAG: M23 family metallopeptidase [Alphaproteobacteria bacterium]|nr:M23 family metallopeptidase [Alphaproteobacteria bacterium]